MNLYSLVNTLREQSLKIPLVNTFVEDVSLVSSYHDLRYGVVTLSQGTSSIEDGFFIWSGSIYYIDRVFDHPSDTEPARKEDNRTILQSNGIDVLHDLLERVKLGTIDESYSTFTHTFLDLCAGARVDVTLRFPYTYCEDFQ